MEASPSSLPSSDYRLRSQVGVFARSKISGIPSMETSGMVYAVYGGQMEFLIPGISRTKIGAPPKQTEMCCSSVSS